MTIRTVIFLIFWSLISCNGFDSKNNSDLQKHLDSITRRPDDAKFCDTCISTLIVEHNECTDCSHLTVDSGVVFISSKVIAQFDSEAKRYLKDKDNIFFKKLNISDLLLDNKNDLYKLWPDTVTWQGWGKKYRVTGQITEYKEARLKFKLLGYIRLDTSYAKKFD